MNIEFVEAEDGGIAVKVNGVFIHSSRSPYSQAVRWADASLKKVRGNRPIVFVLGAGLGYPAVAVAEKFPNGKIVAVEFVDELVEFGKREVVAGSDNVRFLTPSDDLPTEIFGEVQKGADFSDIRIVKFLPSVRLNPKFYSSVEKLILDAVRMFVSGVFTSYEFSLMWIKNFLVNMRYFDKSVRLKVSEADVVSVFGAGPSLDHTDLKSYSSLPILAVDTALKPLLSRGVQPDLVFTADGQIFSLNDFKGVKPDGILVASVFSNPDIVRLWLQMGGEVEFFVPEGGSDTVSAVSDWLFSVMEVEVEKLEAGGTVSSSAFHYAVKRFKPKVLIFAGQDFAYTDLKTHSRGTPHLNFYTRHLSNRFVPLEKWETAIALKRGSIVADGFCGKVKTDFVLRNYARWFEESFKNLMGVKFLFDSCGLRVEGAGQVKSVPKGKKIPVEVHRVGVDFDKIVSAVFLMEREFLRDIEGGVERILNGVMKGVFGGERIALKRGKRVEEAVKVKADEIVRFFRWWERLREGMDTL